eukprot:COSAG06_NODE_2596_length_6606_cov_2.954818_5_plen_389_part_00
MEGDGHISDWLHNTGREIGKAVGSELKGAARDKAVSFAQQMVGRGIADELGMAARSVGASALGAAASQIGNVNDTSSAKRAAASVGRAAVSEGASQLAGLAGKYFRGAGTPEQAVKVCAYTLASLRKIVTAYRRHLAKTPVNDFLMAHAERALASGIVKLGSKHNMAERLHRFVDAVGEPPKNGGYSMAQKRKLVSRIRKALHPPVSSMSREHIVQYIYGLALEQNVNWEPFFEAATERKRVPKGCYRMTGPGTSEYEPPAPRAKRAPSAYNKFVREQMLTYQFPPAFDQKQKMKEIGRLWRQEKESILNEEHYQAVDREDRTDARNRRQRQGITKKRLKKARKIPRRGDDDDLDLTTEETRRGPPGVTRSRGIKRIGGKKRVMLDDD